MVNSTIAHHLKTLCTTQILFNRGRLLQSYTRHESFLHGLSAVHNIERVFQIGECSDRTAISYGKGNVVKIKLVDHVFRVSAGEWKVGWRLLMLCELTIHVEDVIVVGFSHCVRGHASVGTVVGLVKVLDEEVRAGDDGMWGHVVVHLHPVHLLGPAERWSTNRTGFQTKWAENMLILGQQNRP